MRDEHKYDDIINLPHHISKYRPHMSMIERAAQFSAFAALQGHDEAIRETARLTDKRIERNEEEQEILNRKFRILKENINELSEIKITYFIDDEKKEGGHYEIAKGNLKNINEDEQILNMEGGEKICISDIYDIECEIFKLYFN